MTFAFFTVNMNISQFFPQLWNLSNCYHNGAVFFFPLSHSSIQNTIPAVSLPMFQSCARFSLRLVTLASGRTRVLYILALAHMHVILVLARRTELDFIKCRSDADVIRVDAHVNARMTRGERRAESREWGTRWQLRYVDFI
jgi:hypothetical protein